MEPLAFAEKRSVETVRVNERLRPMRNDAIQAGPELICGDCGAHFRARRVTDGVEEICDKCYEARFPAAPVLCQPQRAHTHVHGHLAAD